MYQDLTDILSRPQVFSVYTADTLWTDPHISAEMLKLHLSQDFDLASRRLPFIEKAVSHINNLFSLNGSNVCDLGCGPGLFTHRFAVNGANVTGVDFSPRALAYARDKATQAGLTIDYIEGNYLDIDLPQNQDLMTLIYCDLCALAPAQRENLLKRIAKALKPDGKLLLDVYSIARLSHQRENTQFAHNYMNGFWSPNDYFAFQSSFVFREDAVTLDKYTIIEPARTWEVYNWLQHFSRESLAQEFNKCGLSIRDLFGDLTGSAFDPGGQEFAVVAQPA